MCGGVTYACGTSDISRINSTAGDIPGFLQQEAFQKQQQQQQILSTSSSPPHFPLPTLLLQLLLSPSTTIRLDGRAPSISDLVACFSLALSHILECPHFFTFTIAAALRLEAAACRLQERVHRLTISCCTGSDARGLFGSINNYARVHHSTPHQKHATARV